jgi:hypothetical protein
MGVKGRNLFRKVSTRSGNLRDPESELKVRCATESMISVRDIKRESDLTEVGVGEVGL